jgi:hypothetical protein
MRIIDLTAADSGRIEQVAALLIDGFSDTGSESWRIRDEALLSALESLQQDSRVALYLDPLGAAARIQNLRRHPFEFYRKVGTTPNYRRGNLVKYGMQQSCVR